MKSGKNTIYSVLGIILSLFFMGYAIYNLIHDSAFFFKGETVDMNKSIIAGEELTTDTYMTLTTNSVLGNYAETKHMYGFIPLGKDEHYIILLDDNTFISVTVKGKKTIDRLEKIADETWASEDYYADTSLTLVGRTHNFSGGEIFGYYRDAFTELGIDMNASDSPVRYISLDATENRGAQWRFVILSFVMGGFIIFASLSTLGVIHLPQKTSATPGVAANAANTVIDSNAELDNMMNADPFADNSSNSSYADPFTDDSSSSEKDDTMDSFRTGYEDMMNEKNEKSDDTTSGSGLKLKL